MGKAWTPVDPGVGGQTPTSPSSRRKSFFPRGKSHTVESVPPTRVTGVTPDPSAPDDDHRVLLDRDNGSTRPRTHLEDVGSPRHDTVYGTSLYPASGTPTDRVRRGRKARSTVTTL